ncbi:MAG: TonB-dependent receptor [Bacteroidetes bacterium]|jgi:hypothetical protein|nr:TonB-dependent receptor [Bacteroidota bacterium]
MADDFQKQTLEKALRINLDNRIYGTLAEIGAGQEVARNFFIAGGAAGTVAKSMSAYDMQVSDAIYGEEAHGRYVSRSRVTKMVDREYNLVVERLQERRSNQTLFFAFADTVAAKGYKTTKDCHGWMGLKFQLTPNAEANTIILHVRMKDNTNREQQLALGILGVNLIYGAFYHTDDPEYFIERLVDHLGTGRIEIDMILFSGPDFTEVDNRLMALQLVNSGLTRSVFFNSSGECIQASDLLYKKNILVLRGTFRPVTNVHLDIIRCGKEQILNDDAIEPGNLLFIAEISMANLFNKGNLDNEDFLGRVDTLCKLGFNVQISNYVRYFKLKEHLSQFTNQRIDLVVGVRKIDDIFKEAHYTDLKGGILEAFGILFSKESVLYVYPRLSKSGQQQTIENLWVDDEVKYLFRHFLYTRKMIPLNNYNPEVLHENVKAVGEQIEKGGNEWKDKVPELVFNEITTRGLFGFPK